MRKLELSRNCKPVSKRMSILEGIHLRWLFRSDDMKDALEKLHCAAAGDDTKQNILPHTICTKSGEFETQTLFC